jgi:hypothetical protein
MHFFVKLRFTEHYNRWNTRAYLRYKESANLDFLQEQSL